MAKESIGWWVMGLGAAMLVGSFLPWVRMGVITQAGVDGDGVFAGLAGGAIVVISLANRRGSRAAGSAVSLLGVAGVVVGVEVFGTVSSAFADGSGSIGSGLLVTMMASLLVCFPGIEWAASSRTIDDASSTDGTVVSRLEELKMLYHRGVLSDEEYETRRMQILDEA